MARWIDADALFNDMETADWYNNADRDKVAEPLVLRAPTICGWISVKDCKPPAIPGTGEHFRKENKPVLLLAGKHGSVYVGWYIGEDYRGIDCYISRTSLNAFQCITRKITHWMPIPELCEEDQQ